MLAGGMLSDFHHVQPVLLPGADHWRDVPKGLGMKGSGPKL